MKYLLFAFLAVVLTASAGLASAPENPPISSQYEYIILSGGPSLMLWEKWKSVPHDLWWLNFIRAAEIRIQQLKEMGVPTSQITWMVYQPSFESRSKQEGKNLVGEINTLAASLGVKAKWFSRSQQVFGYLNEGRTRENVKIADLEYFGHSNKACWMFDYSNIVDSASKVWIHEDDLKQIKPGIFAKDAFVKSWGCHTGESMSQKFRRATGLKMWGAVGRSQYMTHELPTLADPGKGKWSY